MAEVLSSEEQLMALRRELAQRDAIIAAREAELAEATIVKAKLTAALLEIEQIKMQLATLRRQRYGRSSEKLDNDIAQLEMRLEDCQEDVGEHLAARPERDHHSAPRRRTSDAGADCGSDAALIVDASDLQLLTNVVGGAGVEHKAFPHL